MITTIIDTPRFPLMVSHVKQDFPQFRTLPEYADAPDRTQWEQDHGNKPWELTDTDPRFIQRAMACLDRDQTELTQPRAITQHNVLDELCEQVTPAGFKGTVYFDRFTQSFWAYPKA